MDAALELAQTTQDAHDAWLGRTKSVVGNAVASSLDAPDVPEGLVRLPANMTMPSSDAIADISREVFLKMQRDTKIADLQEQDDHEAIQEKKLESQRQKSVAEKDGRGRPKKHMSELLTDLGNIVPDRLTHIGDAVVTKEKEVKDVTQDINKDFPSPENMTDAFKQIKETVGNRFRNALRPSKLWRGISASWISASWQQSTTAIRNN